jgi:nitric-oxide synthase
MTALTHPGPRQTNDRHEGVLAEASRFVTEFQRDTGGRSDPARLGEVREQIFATGTYAHDEDELRYAAQVAWRNSNRCIGRLHWKTLAVRDCRSLTTPEDVFDACVGHLRAATNAGKLRSLITVFAPENRAGQSVRIWNPQLIRYAGWRRADGSVIGDPLQIELTAVLERLGWSPSERGRFTVLPLAIEAGGEPVRLFELPLDAVLEVPIAHPQFDWFAELRLRWHAVPVISNMALEAGGLRYPAAPFNGWYMGTEIGARNLADVDRYNQLPQIARRLGLDTRSDRSLWKDRALVELNLAVLHSFKQAGVTMVDHHLASRQFMLHMERERRAGRDTPADWSWVVPPMSPSTCPVFHQYYPEAQLTPAFTPQPLAWASLRRPSSRVLGQPIATRPTQVACRHAQDPVLSS